MVSQPLSGVIADDLGWEWVFYIFGILGVIWFVFWVFICFDTPATHPRISQVLKMKMKLKVYFLYLTG